MGHLYESPTYSEDLDRALDHVVGLENLAWRSVLITGAGGLIGSFLVDVLGRGNSARNLGMKVIATGRNLSRLEKRFSESPFPGIELAEWDVSARPALSARADCIVHAASNAHPHAFVADPVGTMKANIVGLMNVVEWGQANGVDRILYVSSGEVYGIGSADVAAYGETYQGYLDILSPRSSYPMGKRAAETLCAAYCDEYDADIVVVRPSHTYGPSATASDSRANAQFVNDALSGRDIVMKSPGSQVRSYNYVADAVSGLLTVLLNGRRGCAYNLANPDVRVSIAEFAETVARKAGRNVVFADDGEDGDRLKSPIPNQVLDAAALQGLGWSPCYGLEAGVGRTIEIMRGMYA